MTKQLKSAVKHFKTDVCMKAKHTNEMNIVKSVLIKIIKFIKIKCVAFLKRREIKITINKDEICTPHSHMCEMKHEIIKISIQK